MAGAPFDACHEVVDVEAALHNCKYDTCSCMDPACACHALKQFVKECQEAGVTSLANWRDVASYCREYWIIVAENRNIQYILLILDCNVMQK
jgi:PleD family two-component response regulator